ncbi:MAG TPA: proteasome subunit beta [Nanoarchaeota archaeon]|nr:proteasome subunit beta [Candidatus Woesearchaeota archaeon]HIH15686.1 proteasome subunit beta [Nanoarchaeota archaeon]HIH59341.1 proteasome subunit beta [Nanoarchaeota archaeon]HII13581.1 proteasome subunit beta [Nanoarchaeota archaeon]HIJ04798.1 proteasome subunit beta [Nanoarchaeota archaeon]
MMEANPKHGTTTIAMICKDGVVMAADRRATAGYLIAHKKTTKVVPISDHMAITTAGLVSDIQLFTKIIKSQIMLLKMRKGKEPSVKEAANLLANLAYSNIRRPSMIPGIVGFLFGGYDKTGYQLYEISFDGSIMEVDDYASDGSGSSVAIGVLETLYKKDLSVDEGKEIAVRALSAAMSRDSATGNGIDVIVINPSGVEYVIQKEVKSIVK